MDQSRLSGKVINELWGTTLPETNTYSGDDISQITGGILHLIDTGDDGNLTVCYTVYDHHNDPRVEAAFDPDENLIKYRNDWSRTKYNGRDGYSNRWIHPTWNSLYHSFFGRI